MNLRKVAVLSLIATLLFFSSSLAAENNDGLQAKTLLTTKVKDLFEHRKYAELDAMADLFNKNSTTFSDGGYKLRTFTDSFELMTDGDQTYPDWVFTLYRDNAEKWRKANPRSVAARIALAQAWHSYAWRARGNSFANEVKSSAWPIFQKRLDSAWQIMNEPLAPGMSDSPERHMLLLRLANYRGVNRTEFDRLFRESIAIYPEYSGLYIKKAEYLTQRWHGRKGEWQNFIMDVARKNKGGHGATIYTRTAWARSGEWGDFAEDNISWPTMKKGFQEIAHEHPNSPFILNGFAKFACLAKDRKILRSLLRQIKASQLDPEVWSPVNIDDCQRLVKSEQ
jgi:hypothetical protein